MRTYSFSRRIRAALLGALAVALIAGGCQTFLRHFSDRLTHWNMLDDQAVEDPIKAVGGDGIVFVPREQTAPLTRRQLASASPETLVNYYAPIFVQRGSTPRLSTTPTHPSTT
jgi:hypothetical protein